MKRIVGILLCVMLSLSSCTKAPESNAAVSLSKETENIVYVSQIRKENCALCGNQKKSLLSAYVGQKNIGIISINTFDISPVEINRYNDFGNLIETPSETFSITHNGFGEGEMNTHVMPNTDRGYATVDVSFTNDKSVNKSAVENLLCADCLNTIMEDTWGEPYGVGVINFETLEIRLFEKHTTAFTFGDFYVDIEQRENEESPDEVELDLLIFYCPSRYE